MKNHSVTTGIKKKPKVRVNKFFLPVKIALFCWFAGKIISILIGGYIMSISGGRLAYTVVGSIVLIYAAIYAAHVLLRRKAEKYRAESTQAEHQNELQLCSSQEN
ncbi:unnamed protein product [Larinioides sclopetarius]|uniref:Uncharacterized protein n=1 Tax=Larinioides sclopetarius TaxID=280406 RepID=A0AAV2B4V4_9ARAC